jgi:uncharacterized protein YndB with AHSA1/START domain
MESQIQHGYVVLADIAGYTPFIEETEIDHGPEILRDILKLIIEQLTSTMDLAEVEGDAVFVYAPESRISRGELLLELIETAYVAFRDRLRSMQHNVTCPCNACQSISTLDLKFVTHYGDYVLQNVAGTNKPVGSCVNLVHRLLKNRVSETTGWRGYGLFSEKSLEQMGISPHGMQESLESYAHLGEIHTSSINLDERYNELIQDRKVFLGSEEAHVTIPYDFLAPPPVVWDWLNDPQKRKLWIEGSGWEAKERPKGRTGPGARNHCTSAQVVEEILDWRPFEYYTVRYSKGSFNMMITGELEPAAGGTHVQWNAKLVGSLPRWIRRRLCRRFVTQKMQKKKQFGTLARLISNPEISGDAH